MTAPTVARPSNRRRVLDAIREFHRVMGFIPSAREIAGAANVNRTQVGKLCSELVARGQLVRLGPGVFELPPEPPPPVTARDRHARVGNLLLPVQGGTPRQLAVLAVTTPERVIGYRRPGESFHEHQVRAVEHLLGGVR